MGLTGGLTWLFVEFASSDENYNRSTGEFEEVDKNYLAPGIVMGASLVSILIASLISPDQIQPVKRSEALKLAVRHNQKLKTDLGLDADYTVIPYIDTSHSIIFCYEINPILGGAHGAIRIDF